MPWQNISNKCVMLAVIQCFCTSYFRSKRWVINSKREDLLKRYCGYLYNNCRMCANHFTDSQFMNANSRDKLVWDAVPTLFSCNQSDRQKERKPPKDRTSSSEHVVEQDTSILVKSMFLIIFVSDQMIVLL